MAGGSLGPQPPCSSGPAGSARCPTPEEAAAYRYTDQERAFIEATVSTHLIGEPGVVHDGLVELQARTGADEIMLSTRAHSVEARIQSLTLVADGWPMGDVAADTAATAV